eukprot:4646186-Pleurochrysis_carterae.AAC.1
MAVRTFDAAKDDVENGQVQVRWYQRKSSAHSWGSQPAFKFASVFARQGKRLPWLGMISIGSIIAIPVVLTPNSVGNTAEP